ncbi:unnamed protein product [Medioppia subpectinata]|uniref:TATA box-binding protein-like 1 n=1 Tax=Medioppia subpectinata TaxID=1979941 RepID=A0A7R9KJC8_9ACAR|nr:unnamed protein product [Medioppia subpectinata]CAG2103246.1 unnamed protein product [Medioppia subpectinata]
MNAQNGINQSIIHTIDTDIKQEVVSEQNGDNNCQNESIEEPEPEVDITINNVVASFSVKCHLNLRQIACKGSNVEYRREQSMILMKLRAPRVTASIWSSGKISCFGATTEDSAKCGARRVARSLQKMGFKVKFNDFQVVNVLGTCILPFGIKINEFSSEHRKYCSYEPELHPGATYRMKDIRAVLKVFQTGSITITARSIGHIQEAVERIYPLVHEYRKPKPSQSSQTSQLAKNNRKIKSENRTNFIKDEEEDIEEDIEEENFDIVIDEEESDEDTDDYSDKSD